MLQFKFSLAIHRYNPFPRVLFQIFTNSDTNDMTGLRKQAKLAVMVIWNLIQGFWLGNVYVSLTSDRDWSWEQKVELLRLATTLGHTWPTFPVSFPVNSLSSTPTTLRCTLLAILSLFTIWFYSALNVAYYQSIFILWDDGLNEVQNWEGGSKIYTLPPNPVYIAFLLTCPLTPKLKTVLMGSFPSFLQLMSLSPLLESIMLCLFFFS